MEKITVEEVRGENDLVAEKAVAYVRDFYDHIFSEGKKVVHLISEDSWVRQDNGPIRRQPTVRPVYSGSSLTTVSSYKMLIKALSGDKVFSKSLGKLVGNALTGYKMVQLEDVVRAAEATLLQPNGSIEFNEKLVARTIQTARKLFQGADQTSLLLIPLRGLKLASGFELIENVEFDTFKDTEIEALAEAGLISPIFSRSPVLQEEDCVGVRVTLHSPTRIIDPGGTFDEPEIGELKHEFGILRSDRTADIVEDVLAAMRIANAGYVAAPGALIRNEDMFGASSSSWNVRTTHPFPRGEYLMTADAQIRFKQLWQLLTVTAGPGNKIPALALRRFNAAVDRVALDDAIVDLLISAEALLLKDSGSPDDRSELGYRMSLRGSKLLAKRGLDRRGSFKDLKAAYNLRSRIAHGGDLPAVVKVSGKDVEIGEFVAHLTNLMRNILLQAAEEARSNPIFGTIEYWDDEILGL